MHRIFVTGADGVQEVKEAEADRKQRRKHLGTDRRMERYRQQQQQTKTPHLFTVFHVIGCS